jgi:hypothetical protein
MMGFPSGVTFHPYGFARNVGTASLTLHSSVNYMDGSGPHTLVLPDEVLAVGQALNLQPSSAVQLPAKVGSANLSFNFAGDCSSLLLATGSVDTTGNYVFEVAPTGVAPGNGRQLLHWQVDNGYDSMFSLWNPSPQAEDLVATVYFEPEESTYTVPITLAANASTILDIMELMEAGKPDVNGNTIPAGAHIGSLVVTGTSPDLRDTVTFVAAGGVYNPLSGTCAIICTDCTGAVSGELSPASPSVAADHTQAFTFYVNNSSGTQTNYTTTATWSSSDTSVATVQSGQASAVSSGSTEISATSPSIPAGTGQSCIDGDEVISSCYNAQYSGATTLTVYDDTPSNISVSPSSYTVGTATSFTITGQNLGTNCPQLTWPFSASYSLSSCGNTSVSGTVTASAAGSGDLTFTAEGYGGEGFSPGPGQQQTAQSATVSATNPPPTISYNGTVISGGAQQSVVVGQQVTLTGSPSGGTWSIPGTYSSWSGNGGGPAATSSTANPVSFYWVSGGSQTATYTRSGNGSASAKFGVSAPTASVDVSPFHSGLDGSGVQFYISLNATVTGPSGSLSWYQVINSISPTLRTATGALYCTFSITGSPSFPVLDNSAPYGTGPGMSDNPELVATGITPPPSPIAEIQGSQSFTTYLLWQPTGVGTSYPVPLANVPWNWTATAVWSSSNNQWSLGTNGSQSESVVNSSSYPTWSAILPSPPPYGTCH